MEMGETINHPLCGCASIVIQKNYLSVYNKVVQAILQKGKVIYGEERTCTRTYKMDVQISYRLCNDIVNHTSLYEFYQGRLLLHLTIPFEEKPKNNLPGDNLKYYRQRKSLTTRQLAEQVDVVPSTILVYEQNKRPIPYDMANRLAEVLDVDVTILYDDFAAFLSVPYNEALKDIRSALKMSQRAFAEHIGVIPSYYYKLEAGLRRPSRKVYQQVVNVLGGVPSHPFHSAWFKLQ